MTRFEDWLFEPQPGFFGEMLRAPFSAMSLLYLLGVKIRLFAYQKSIFQTHLLQLPVISIGNLTLGGTGKTPCVIWLARALEQKGIKTAISIRGYGSPAENALLLVDGKSKTPDPAEVGDESAMMAQALPEIPLLVGKNRILAGAKAKELGAQILILDDGFQHLKIHREMDIVLIDGNKLLNAEKMFPRGKLREPLSSLRRADIVILSKPGEMAEEILAEIKKIHPACPIFKMRYQALYPEKFYGKKAYLFAGIADPEQFFKLCQSLKIHIVGKKAFSDHHQYNDKEIWKINAEAKKRGAEILLTTEKDFVRLKGFKSEIPVQTLPIKPDFFGDEEKIVGLIMNRLKGKAE